MKKMKRNQSMEMMMKNIVKSIVESGSIFFDFCAANARVSANEDVLRMDDRVPYGKKDQKIATIPGKVCPKRR